MPPCDVRPEVVLSPDLAGCLPRSVRPDGRSSRGVCKIGSDTGRTAHFQAVCAQREALKPDARPWPWRRHMIGWPIWPAIDLARPCECHATTTHLTAAVEGACWHHPRPERLRLALCNLCRRTCASHVCLIGMCHRVGARAGARSEPT